MRRLGAFACLLAPAAAHAQLAPVGVPGGMVRVELDGRIDIWDSRYVDGALVPLGADLTTSALGRSLLPFLSDADARLERITGITGYGLDLGALTTDAQRDQGTGILGVSIGLTNGITIFGRIPLVRARAQSTIALGPATSDAGPNPGAGVQAGFFTELDAALATLSANIGNGAYNGNAAKLALAQSTLASGTALGDDLFGLLSDPSTASPFVPVAVSAAGTAISSRIAALQTTLANNLGVSGFTAAPLLPTTPVTEAELLSLLSDPTGPVGLLPGGSTITFRGDAEAGAALTLLDRWDRDGHRGGFRAAVDGLVRFPTGRVPRPDRLFAVGTGDGQTDVEGRVTADLGSGNFGIRLEGDYNRQLAADMTAWVAQPGQPLAGFITNVRNDPGDITTVAARPFYRLARTLAIQGSAVYWSRGADEVTYATPADEIPGVDPSVLAVDTKANATVLGIGLTYANPGAQRPGGRGLPVDAGWGYERVVKSSAGRVPNRHSITARFRFYFGLF